jgi:hypothetical protein
MFVFFLILAPNGACGWEVRRGEGCLREEERGMYRRKDETLKDNNILRTLLTLKISVSRGSKRKQGSMRP